MMSLTTISHKTSENTARVFWRTGTVCKGILDVHVDFEHEEIDLVAELAAIRYLIFERRVFNRAPSAGNGYKLVVSKGAIRKLALGKSTKKFAEKFASFLSSRLQGAVIDVSQNMEFMASLEEAEIQTLHVERKVYANTYDEIDTPAIGKILITRHAVERYQERITSGDPKKPRGSLVRRLLHPGLHQIPLTDKILRHKERKYGRDNQVEAWRHPDSRMTFLFVIEEGQRILVSAFEAELD